MHDHTDVHINVYMHVICICIRINVHVLEFCVHEIQVRVHCLDTCTGMYLHNCTSTCKYICTYLRVHLYVYVWVYVYVYADVDLYVSRPWKPARTTRWLRLPGCGWHPNRAPRARIVLVGKC